MIDLALSESIEVNYALRDFLQKNFSLDDEMSVYVRPSPIKVT